MSDLKILDERRQFIQYGNADGCSGIKCDSDSLSGAVSQRACVYCGARVVLNPLPTPSISYTVQSAAPAIPGISAEAFLAEARFIETAFQRISVKKTSCSAVKKNLPLQLMSLLHFTIPK